MLPAALAGLAYAPGVPNLEILVTTVSVAVILTLGLQTTNKRWLAERLWPVCDTRMAAVAQPAVGAANVDASS